jgi:hypothetical protein
MRGRSFAAVVWPSEKKMLTPIRTSDMIKGNILTREMFYPEDVCILCIYALRPTGDGTYEQDSEGGYIKEQLREVHYKNNKIHRQNGPAEITFSHGMAQVVLYKTLDQIHRIHGPAHIVFDEIMEVKEQEWWLYGIKLTEKEHFFFVNSHGPEDRKAAVIEYSKRRKQKTTIFSLRAFG